MTRFAKLTLRYWFLPYFRGDFGGKDGAVSLFKEYDIIPGQADPSIEFREYGWTLNLDNFQDL
jgi:hypothetical protein